VAIEIHIRGISLAKKRRVWVADCVGSELVETLAEAQTMKGEELSVRGIAMAKLARRRASYIPQMESEIPKDVAEHRSNHGSPKPSLEQSLFGPGGRDMQKCRSEAMLRRPSRSPSPAPAFALPAPVPRGGCGVPSRSGTRAASRQERIRMGSRGRARGHSRAGRRACSGLPTVASLPGLGPMEATAARPGRMLPRQLRSVCDRVLPLS